MSWGVRWGRVTSKKIRGIEQPGKATLVPAVKTVDRSTLTAKDYDLDAGSSHVVK